MKKEELDDQPEGKPKTSKDLIWDFFQTATHSVVFITWPPLKLQSLKVQLPAPQVTEERNIGKWLTEHYGDHDRFQKVIQRVVYDRVSQFKDHCGDVVTLIPNASVQEMYVKLCQLDYSEDAKSGCCLDL